MTRRTFFCAVDLGSESGRCSLVSFDGGRLYLDEVHRFSNDPVGIFDTLYWDPLKLFAEVKHGLQLCAQQANHHLHGIGVDTWGVDFALLGRDGEMLGYPVHYRDRRTSGMMEEAFKRVAKEEIFERTGIQFMPINTLYQLLSLVLREAPVLEVAVTFLTIPDLFNFWLTGEEACEFSNATTTQLYDQRARGWSFPLIEKLGIPTHIFPQIVQPGNVLGRLLPSLAAEVGMKPIPVIAPVCHDTGSAVAGVPANAKNFAFISSGTWSIVGVETNAPVITKQSFAYNFTNEGGVSNTVRFSKNVMGLWLIQECRRIWAQAGNNYSYAELISMAEKARPFQSFVNPDDEAFLRTGDMIRRIQEYCKKTGQPVPEEQEEVLRCVFESLALKYRFVVNRIEKMLGYNLEVIHIVGGGTRNRLLCQLTADATGKPVIAGPVEATTFGNVLVQALGLGLIKSHSEGREVIGRSVDLVTYEPCYSSRWEEAYNRFQQILSV